MSAADQGPPSTIVRTTVDTSFVANCGICRKPIFANEQSTYDQAGYYHACCLPPAKLSAVESPAHYTQGRLEVIYQIQDALGKDGFKQYCIGNALKYINRFNGKNGDEDLQKAHVYLGWATNGLPEPVNGGVPK